MKKAKGVQHSVVDNEIRFENYLAAYKENREFVHEVRGFRSRMHEVITYATNKRSLTCYDDKRSWLDDNFSVAYGHWRTKRPRID
jgi:hypothetical protein